MRVVGASQGRGAVDDERAAVAGRGRVQAQRAVRDATSLPRREDRCVGPTHQDEKGRGLFRDVFCTNEVEQLKCRADKKGMRTPLINA